MKTYRDIQHLIQLGQFKNDNWNIAKALPHIFFSTGG